jgi:hypothetical protein
MKSIRHHHSLPWRIGARAEPCVQATAYCVSLIASLPLLAVVGSACAADDNAAEPSFAAARPIKLDATAQEKITLKYFRAIDAVPPEPFFEEAESIRCRTSPLKFCRDFSKTEIQITSLRFMVPPVPGLAPKSLTFRHNAVIANYTFK